MAVAGAQNDNQLSKLVGIPQTTISGWRSKNRVPFGLCVEVAQRFNTSIDWLLFGRENNSYSSVTTNIGSIDIEMFRGCYTQANKIHKLRPALDFLDIVAVIYNAKIPLLKKLMNEGYSYSDTMGLLDLQFEPPTFSEEEFAKIIEERIAAHNNKAYLQLKDR